MKVLARKKKTRRNVVAKTNILKGGLLTPENMIIKRPGYRISPIFFNDILL